MAEYQVGQRFQVGDAVYEYDGAGFSLVGGQQGSQSIVTKPADPTRPFDIQKAGNQAAASAYDPALAAADLEAKRRAAATAPFDARKAEADAIKAEAEARKVEEDRSGGPDKKRRQVLDNDLLLTNIARARELVEQSGTTGFAAALNALPATDARRLSNLLDTIRSNLTFDRLQQMRDESKTGGAVGNASDADMKLLGATAGSLDQYQKSSELLTVLDDVENKYRGFHALLDGKDPNEPSVKRDYGFVGIARAGAGGGDGPDRSPRLLGGGETDGVTLARKGQRFASETDKRFNTLAQTMLDNGASAAEANEMAGRLGYKPQGGRPIFDAKEWATAQRYNATVRDGQPRATVTTPETGVSDPTFLNRAAGGDIGAGVGGYLNGISAGFLDEGVGAIDSLFSGRPLDEAIAEADFKKGLSATNSPKANFLGNAAGGLTGALTGGALLGRVAPGIAQATRAGGVFSPGAIGADLAYGGLFGAGESNDNRLGGAATGMVLAGPAGMLGRTAGKGLIAASRTAPAQKLSDTIRRVGGLDPRLAPPRPGAADRAAFGALNKAGADDVTAQLREADGLGVPMTLADTHPELRSLAGASVRRSPTASLHAENTLIPRSRGQIDRFGQAVERDLGPVANIPQLSDDLIKQARENAGPLYQTAYAAPPISTPELSSVLETPFARSALGRAHGIAANERRDPAALGFTLDSNGSVVLNPVAADAHGALAAARSEFDEANRALTSAKSRSSGSGAGKVGAAEARVAAASQKLQSAQDALAAQPTAGMAATSPGFTPQTLDYVKRGMDDVLEVYRNPITRRLDLDEAGKAQNAVRSQFLKEVDRVNPAYADARAAYAGPAGEKEALYAGQRAFGTHPDQLGVMLQGQTPERLGQMQLGYRGSLMDAGNRARYSSNPFDATLGTPAAEQRLATMFPENPGVPNLLRQRDIERSLANTTNDILGNSKTAQRGLADQEFGVGDLASTALDVGVNIATGQVPTGLVLKQGAGQAIKDWWKLGIGSKARQKAEDLAPVLLNPNPLANIDEITRLQASSEAFDQFIAGQRRRLARPIGMFGSVAASQGQY